MSPRPTRTPDVRPTLAPRASRAASGLRGGAIAGGVGAVLAVILRLLPTARMQRWGWAPTLAEAALAPLAGGLAAGALCGVLRSWRRSKPGALAAGALAGAPFGLGIMFSLTGGAAWDATAASIGAAVGAVIVGPPLGALIDGLDRP